MRLLLKILAAPITIALALFTWICSGLLYCSSWIFGLAGTLLGIAAVIALISGLVKNGIILLVMAFLVSPMGLPMAAAWLLGLVQRFRYHIQERVCG